MSLCRTQVFETDDQGRIVRERDHLDQETLHHQLGVLPSAIARR